MSTEKRYYNGVYGIIIKDNCILLIKKARGPYKGMYDLPGGQKEVGETDEQTLEREIIEEVGCKVISKEFIGNNEYDGEYTNDKGEFRIFNHKGVYFKVVLNSYNFKTEADGHDSLGCEFVSLNNLDKVLVSPLALPMILKVC